MNKQQLSLARVDALWSAAKARLDGNLYAAAHYTVKARSLASQAGYRATYGGRVMLPRVMR